MAYFNNTSSTKRITLPSDENYWVEVSTNLRYGEKKHLAAFVEGQVDFGATLDNLLRTVIKEWNLDDEQGQVLPINAETIDRIDADDAAHIINEMADFITEQAKKADSKKKSSPGK